MSSFWPGPFGWGQAFVLASPELGHSPWIAPAWEAVRGAEGAESASQATRCVAWLITLWCVKPSAYLRNRAESWLKSKIGLRAVPRGSTSYTGAEATSGCRQKYSITCECRQALPTLSKPEGPRWWRVPSHLPYWFQAQSQYLCSATELKLLWNFFLPLLMFTLPTEAVYPCLKQNKTKIYLM